MSNLTAVPELPYKHLAVVPASVADLLLVTFDADPPLPNTDLIAPELFEQDASEAVMTCLSAAHLVIDAARAKFLGLEKASLARQDEVGDHVRRAILEGALERRRQATHFVGAANSVLHRDYMEDVNTDDDPSSYRDSTRQYNQTEIAALRERTMSFIGQPALQTIIALKRIRVEGFPEPVRSEAELTLRVMYDGVDLQTKRRTHAA